MNAASHLYLAAAALAISAAPGVALGAAHPEVPRWNAAAIDRACVQAIARTRAQTRTLERTSSQRQLFAAWDRLQIILEDVQGPVELLANVSPDAATRTAAEACQLKLTALATDVLQNQRIYERIRQTAPKDAVDQKLRKDVLGEFEDKGVALSDERRTRMKQILLRLEELRQSFDRNIRDNKTRLAFSPEEVRGLPPSYLQRAKRDEQGNYLLGFEYPEYEPFLANAENEEARKRYMIAFSNRGTADNLVLLAEAGRLRSEIAQLYGLPSYAHFVIRRRMAETPENVLRFLEDVKARVREAEKREIDELRQLKSEHLGKPIAEVTLQRWDIPFYQEKMRRSRYSIDQEGLRSYFPTDATVGWALDVSASLYGVRFVQRKVQAWHPSVRYYDVVDAKSGRFLSGVYLDLFPREGKYGHAAAFGVRGSSSAVNRTPLSTLVTNFNPKGLDFREVETLMHEFGHVLHGVLSRTRYVSQAGTNVERDFVEAPSQMYEEWARRIETLGLLRRRCADCPAVDDALVRRLQDARLYGAGIRYARQHLYAAFDMALASGRAEDPLKTWIAMESESPAGYIPGTAFPGTFGHVMSGYAAGYYGYMWSEVLALDMLSAFGDRLMDSAVGARLRRTILKRGAEIPAASMVRTFLGRAPSPNAFFAEITGKRKH